MKQNFCPNCGANEWEYSGAYVICEYCGSKLLLEQADKPLKTSNVALVTDIDILLQRCRADPANARKYAGLVLDIDPTNALAKQYFNTSHKRRKL